jgi:hypothetical protein
LTPHQNQTGRPGPAHSRAGWFFGAVASTKIAVTLIAVLVFVLAGATVVEGARGRAAVEYYVYHSWWFVGIFVLISVNVLAAMLVRLPWSRHQIDFVVTHAGLLALLVGMTVSLVDAIQGNLTLQPGERADSIELVNRSELTVGRVDAGRFVQVTMPFADVACEITPDAFAAGTGGRRIAVRVVQFHHAESVDAPATRRRDRSGAMPHATALVELRSGDSVQRVWVERNGQPREVRLQDTQLLLALASQRKALGFSVELVEFRQTTNPGGYGIASSVGKIRFVDDDDSNAREAEIAVNRPASHQGFRFIQAGVRRTMEDTAAVTIVVSRDRGRILKYLGVTLVCAGMVLTVITRVNLGFDAARNDVSKPEPPHIEAEG